MSEIKKIDDRTVEEIKTKKKSKRHNLDELEEELYLAENEPIKEVIVEYERELKENKEKRIKELKEQIKQVKEWLQ